MIDNARVSITCNNMFASTPGTNMLSDDTKKTYYYGTRRNITVLLGAKGSFIILQQINSQFE